MKAHRENTRRTKRRRRRRRLSGVSFFLRNLRRACFCLFGDESYALEKLLARRKDCSLGMLSCLTTERKKKEEKTKKFERKKKRQKQEMATESREEKKQEEEEDS